VFSQLMDAPDTTRIAAQVVTGIGFLCSGIMFKEGFNVRGMNTAATIWCTAAIGVLCSSGMLLHASAAAAVLIACSLIFRPIADRIKPLARFGEEENTYTLTLTCTKESEFGVRALIMNLVKDSRLLLINLKSADEVGEIVEIEASVQVTGINRNEHIERITSDIALEKGVSKAGWKLM